MFCRSISWFVCTLVAVAIATGSIGEDGENYISVRDPQVRVHHLTTDKPQLSTAEPIPNIKASTGVDLGAGEGAMVTLVAHRAATSPESPAQTSTPPSEGNSTTPTEPHSDHSNHGPTPVPAASSTTPHPCVSSGSNDVCPLWSLGPDEKGRRLIEAAKQGAVGEVDALLAAGADVGTRDEDNTWTALHWAAWRGHVEAARRLLAAGAAVDARDAGQVTPLHCAVRRGHTAVARLLLANNADHSARVVGGVTPLHVAAAYGHTEMAAALLEAGADRGAREDGGRTPLDIAREENQQQLVDVLEGRQRSDSLHVTK